MEPNILAKLIVEAVIATTKKITNHLKNASEEERNYWCDELDNSIHKWAIRCCRIMLLVPSFFLIVAILQNELSKSLLVSTIPFFVNAIVFYLFSFPRKRVAKLK